MNTLLTRGNHKSLLEASKEVSLEVNTEKTKYAVMSRHQNVGQNKSLEPDNKCGKVQVAEKNR
jgi:hypothetical protein